MFLFLQGCRWTSPGEILKTKNAQKAISGQFCIAIKVSNLPEVCLSADVSEEKVPIYSMLLNVFEVGRASSVTCAYSLVSRWSLVRSSHPAFFRGDLVVKKHSTTFLSLPLIQEGQLSVTGERICTKYW